jgi:hypothetical protein
MALDDQIFIITRQKDTQKIHLYPILETTVISGDFTMYSNKSSLLALTDIRKNWDKRMGNNGLLIASRHKEKFTISNPSLFLAHFSSDHKT